MCRCVACNRILDNQESTRKFAGSGEYVDMCNTCLGTIEDDVDTIDGEHYDDEKADEE